MTADEREAREEWLKTKLKRMWRALDKSKVVEYFQRKGIDIGGGDIRFLSTQNIGLLLASINHNCSRECSKQFTEVVQEYLRFTYGYDIAEDLKVYDMQAFEQKFAIFGVGITKYKVCDCAAHIFDKKECAQANDEGILECPHCGMLETTLEKNWIWHECDMVDILQDLFENPVSSAMMRAWFHFLQTEAGEEGLVRGIWESPRFKARMAEFKEFFKHETNVFITNMK